MIKTALRRTYRRFVSVRNGLDLSGHGLSEPFLVQKRLESERRENAVGRLIFLQSEKIEQNRTDHWRYGSRRLLPGRAKRSQRVYRYASIVDTGTGEGRTAAGHLLFGSDVFVPPDILHRAKFPWSMLLARRRLAPRRRLRPWRRSQMRAFGTAYSCSDLGPQSTVGA